MNKLVNNIHITAKMTEFVEDEGVVRGIATTSGIDVSGETIAVNAFGDWLNSTSLNNLPMYYEHDYRDTPIGKFPIGEMTYSNGTLNVVGYMDKSNLKTQGIIDAMKFGSVGGLSIGFVRQGSDKKNKLITKGALVEISITPMPANQQSTIQEVRNMTQSNVNTEGTAVNQSQTTAQVTGGTEQLNAERLTNILSAYEQRSQTASSELRSQVQDLTGVVNEIQSYITRRNGNTASSNNEVRTALGNSTVEQFSFLGRNSDSETANDYTGAFMSYLSSTLGSAVVEQRTLNLGSSPDGGYFIPPVDMLAQIERRVFDTSDFMPHSGSVTVANTIGQAVISRDESRFSWVGEGEQKEGDRTIQFGNHKYEAHKFAVRIRVTNDLILARTPVDVVAHVMQESMESRMRQLTTAFVTGNGSNRPRGITSANFTAENDSAREYGTLQYVNTGNNSGLANDDRLAVINTQLIPALKRAYLMDDAAFYMNRRTLGVLNNVRDSNGNLLLSYGYGKAAGALPIMLFGYPIRLWEDLPNITTRNAYSVFFGSLRRGYNIVNSSIPDRVKVDDYSVNPVVIFATISPLDIKVVILLIVKR